MLTEIKRIFARAYIKLFHRLFQYSDFDKYIVEKHPELLGKLMHLLLFDCRNHTSKFVMEAASRDDYFRELMSSDKVKKNAYQIFRDEVLRKTDYSDTFWSDGDIQEIYINLAKSLLVKDRKYFEECLSVNTLKTLAYKKLMSDTEFLVGGISCCLYYTACQTLVVNGWFLPASTYDTVEVYSNNMPIGTAVLQIFRPDVYKDYINANESYAGWELVITSTPGIYSSSIIQVKAKKGDTILCHASKAVTIRNDEYKKGEETEKKELLVFTENGLRYETINMHALKRIYRRIVKAETESRSSDNHYRLKRETEKGLVSDYSIELKQTSEPFTGLSELMDSCAKNRDFYVNYMGHSNNLRIQADYKFLREKDIPRSCKILDIGAVPPMLTYLFNKDGYNDITIIDPAADHFRTYFEEHGISFYNGNILTDQFNLVGKFDLVILSEVLEHLSGNVLNAIGKIKGFIKEGGLLYVTTPNASSISGLIGVLRYQSGLPSKLKDNVYSQYERFEKTGYYGHLREYTSKEVIELMKKMGFELIDHQNDAEFRNTDTIVVALEQTYPQFGVWGKYLFKLSS